MFFSKKKGTYAYLKKAPVWQGLITIVLLLLPAGLFFIGYSITKDVKNLFTVAAVLGALPAAKSIVSFIMFLRAEKWTCPSKLYEETKDLPSQNCRIGYDYYMTSYSVNYPIYCAAVGKLSLIGYLADSKSSENDCESYLKEYLKKNEISGITVKIFKDEEKFKNRLQALSSSEDALSEAEEKAFALLSFLSL